MFWRDDIQSEQITTCREAGRVLKCGKVRRAASVQLAVFVMKTPTLGGRRSTHVDTSQENRTLCNPCEESSPVDYNLMIFSQLKLKGFKIMTKTKTK